MSFMTTLALLVAAVSTSAPPPMAPATTAAAARSVGPQHDFDWEIGTWETKVRIRRNPLAGEPADWVEYAGTSVVRSLLGGRANFVELSVKGLKGKIEGGSLRLFNPQAEQWSLNYANLRDGRLTAPVYGGFDANGRGLFFGQDTLDGRAVLVRFIITRPSRSEARFEQAYSVDGGATWEDNWIAVDTLR
jgi:hypothetical protein